MTRWYSKNIGDGIKAYEPSKQIQEAFPPLFTAAGTPVSMAVFSRYDLETNVVTVYFSPEAAELAQIFSATPCEKPSFENSLGLLAGDQKSIGILFPETQNN